MGWIRCITCRHCCSFQRMQRAMKVEIRAHRPTCHSWAFKAASECFNLFVSLPLVPSHRTVLFECGCLGGSVPTVPMLVFPSASAPHQLNAVAIIPSATSSCSTIVPLPWQGSSQQMPQPNPQPHAPVAQPMSLPLQPQNVPDVSLSAPAVEPAGEISPLVSLALSASGIAQGTGPHVYHPSISPNQLAHFQMLMARPISMIQNPEAGLPQTAANTIQTQQEQVEDSTSDETEPQK